MDLPGADRITVTASKTETSAFPLALGQHVTVGLVRFRILADTDKVKKVKIAANYYDKDHHHRRRGERQRTCGEPSASSGRKAARSQPCRETRRCRPWRCVLDARQVHLLNVPAGKMGAFPDDVENFYRWLLNRGHRYEAHSFVPRMIFGEYLRETLHEAAEARPDTVRLNIFEDDAVDVVRDEDKTQVILGSGDALFSRNASCLRSEIFCLPTLRSAILPLPNRRNIFQPSGQRCFWRDRKRRHRVDNRHRPFDGRCRDAAAVHARLSSTAGVCRSVWSEHSFVGRLRRGRGPR